MKFKSFSKNFIICFFLILCFACTCVYADLTADVAEKIRQGKANAQRVQQELSAEIRHIHDEISGQTSSTLNPTSVSSRRAVENMDFVQMLRDSIPVITGINSRQLMNAAHDASLAGTISRIEDDAVRSSFESRLEKLSSAREKYAQDVEKTLATLSVQMVEIDPNFPAFTLWISSEQMQAWVREFQNYIRNNPYSLQSHSYVSVEMSLAELRRIHSWMNSLSEELDALEKDLRNL